MSDKPWERDYELAQTVANDHQACCLAMRAYRALAQYCAELEAAAKHLNPPPSDEPLEGDEK